MDMIIGGACQGKKALASKKYPDIIWVNGREADWDSIRTAQGIFDFHEFIRREMQADKDVSELAECLIDCNPDVILVSDEVGYGVVPMDKFDRAYREAVGRICTKLAAYSSEVTRVVCGIGMVIKHA